MKIPEEGGEVYLYTTLVENSPGGGGTLSLPAPGRKLHPLLDIEHRYSDYRAVTSVILFLVIYTIQEQTDLYQEDNILDR